MFENLCIRTGLKPYDFLSEWNIEIRPLDHMNKDFFTHSTSEGKLNGGIPSGVTGQREIILFLHDNSNLFYNRENSDRVQHEFWHARLLIHQKFNTMNKDWVDKVHSEPKRFFITFWFWHKVFWKKFIMSVFDLRVVI